jgi:5-hydroxyisourate hydrolase-like protein (transthyretin family)
MNWLGFLLALVVFQTSAVPQQQQQSTASITGYVVKIGTGDPVSKASVTITLVNGARAQTYTATTANNGQFAFQNLVPGQYRLSATRSGYVRTEYGARSPNRPGLPITLNAGQKMTDVALQIMQAGTIAGRVYDRDGEPLANVTVEALKYSYQEGQRVMNVVQTARTNDLGEYRLFWLQPGQYFVSATPPEGQRGALLNALAVAGPGIAGAISDAIANRGGGGNGGGAGRGGGRGGQRGDPPPAPQPPAPATSPQAQEQPAEGYVPVYFPGTTEAQSAAPINLPAGVVFSGVDLTVALVRTLRVVGQVINGVTGQPAQNATVALLPVQRPSGGGGFRGGIRNAGNLRSRINNQGGFEVRGVVPGSYELTAVLNDRNNRMSARLPIEIGNADIQNVSLIVTPGFTLPGRLVVEGQQPATANQNQNAPRIRVMLRPDSAGQVAGAPPAANVQPDGTFSLEQVGRDDYRISVSGMPRNGYVKMARYGATDVMSEGLRLDRQPTGSLDILVSTNTGIADGVVQNEKQEPAANVVVVLVPEAMRSRLDLYKTASTDAVGHFHAEGIAPGDYRAFAFEDVENGAWQDPDFLRQFEDRGKRVTISENGTANLELRLISSQ